MDDIEVQNITKKFGDFTAVDNVSFAVEHGEIFALLGPNGAGKSTLIRMLTTLIPATAGVARVGGHDIVKEPDAVRRLIGVIPQGLLAREKGHRGITRLEVVTTMHERKARMAELADGFIALPGGLGTLEEFCEILTWSQLGIHGKPVALYNVSRFFDPLLDLFDHAVKEGFLRPEHRQLVLVADEVEELLQAMHDYRPATVEQWEVADATKLGT